MPKRKAMSKKVRFEVFKRDKFTCQYCGEQAPDVVLHVDHVKPVAKGGKNDLLNLVTSCTGCNSGKGARELGDDAEIKKQRQAIDDLAEKRAQLDRMLDWKEQELDLDGHATARVHDVFRRQTGYVLGGDAIAELAKWIRRHGAAEIMECVVLSADAYLHTSADKVYKMIPRIAKNRREERKDPLLGPTRKIFYELDKWLGGNRDQWWAQGAIRSCLERGLMDTEIRQMAMDGGTWWQFKQAVGP